MKVIDFHVHVNTDNFLPAEAIRCAKLAGYRAIGLMVRADSATISLLLPWLLQLSRHYGLYAGIEVFAGVELVHVPPPIIYEAVAEARSLGAAIVAVHGETPVGDVEPGTNLAAIESEIDILFHPGLIRPEEAELAAQHGVALELTAAPLHSLANAHVAHMAEQHGCGLVFGSDAKAPHHLATEATLDMVLRGARASEGVNERLHTTSNALLKRLLQM